MSYPSRGNQGETADQLVRSLVPDDIVKAIIRDTDANYVNALNDRANAIGKRIKETVTTSQIRGIFSLVREIEQDTLSYAAEAPLSAQVERRLSMLRPKLAYQVGRVEGQMHAPKKVQMQALATILTSAIDTVLELRTVGAFRNFVDFFEAILAYHKYYGGQDKGQR